ncbi:MAG: hypothetical protein QNJ41_02615 [Xenococcaceae cyanobacterium MO_188.B32]|nr:hypothetical protein [Xenococcaceae cyanobacterium MO_188.B32]
MTQEQNTNSETDSPNSSLSKNESGEKEYVEEASKFINETSLDKMHEIAEIARRKKLTEPPKWVIPDDI